MRSHHCPQGAPLEIHRGDLFRISSYVSFEMIPEVSYRVPKEVPSRIPPVVVSEIPSGTHTRIPPGSVSGFPLGFRRSLWNSCKSLCNFLGVLFVSNENPAEDYCEIIREKQFIEFITKLLQKIRMEFFHKFFVIFIQKLLEDFFQKFFLDFFQSGITFLQEFLVGMPEKKILKPFQKILKKCK